MVRRGTWVARWPITVMSDCTCSVDLLGAAKGRLTANVSGHLSPRGRGMMPGKTMSTCAQGSRHLIDGAVRMVYDASCR